MVARRECSGTDRNLNALRTDRAIVRALWRPEIQARPVCVLSLAAMKVRLFKV